MSSIFKIVSSEQWQEANITGMVPRSEADTETSIEGGVETPCILVNRFEDLEVVCSELFTKEDFPLALEFSPESYPGMLKWLEPTDTKPWEQGKLYTEQLLADLVLGVYSFAFEGSDNNPRFRLLGEQ